MLALRRLGGRFGKSLGFGFARRGHTIAMIHGDGVGREVVPEAKAVLDLVNERFLGNALSFIELEAGYETFETTGKALPEETLEALQTECSAAVFGAVSSPIHRVVGYSSPIIGMRKALNLYANLRPYKSLKVPDGNIVEFAEGVDLLVVRENTECLYVKRERYENHGKTAIADRVITYDASKRIAEMAFGQAMRRAENRARKGEPARQPKVTIVHKANVLSYTDGLFRETALEVAKDFPDVEIEEQIVDSMVYKLIIKPQNYDVIVAPNLYGDIISDAIAARVGGLGVAPSANVGDSFALVEPVHGSAPDIAGEGIVNPIATIRATVLMLEFLALQPSTDNPAIYIDAAARVDQAVTSNVLNGPRTKDLGGTAHTTEVTKDILARIESQ